MFNLIIEKRTNELKKNLDKITSNRKKLDFLKNYYKNKTAIIVGTGPNCKNYINIIKENFNENCILICIKQAIKDFDMISDFHVYNECHYEKYNYKTIKPIILFMNHTEPDKNNFRKTHDPSDINFFLCNLKGINHVKKDILMSIEKYENLFEFNDNNLGIGENMVPNGRHIIFELCMPLAISLGCSNIITVGWVGGCCHGTTINNQLNWDTEENKYLYKEQNLYYEKSAMLPMYLYNNYAVNIFSLGETNYKINIIDENEFKNIVNDKKFDVKNLLDI